MLKLSCETKLTRRQSQWTILKIPQKHTKGKHFSYGDRRELQGYYPINLYVILSSSWLDILIALPILSVMN